MSCFCTFDVEGNVSKSLGGNLPTYDKERYPVTGSINVFCDILSHIIGTKIEDFELRNYRRDIQTVQN